MAPWSSGCHYCTTSFNKVWTQVLCRFKSCSWRVGDARWWGSRTMVPAGNKAKSLSSVNHTTKTIHHHYHHHHHHSVVFKLKSSSFFQYSNFLLCLRLAPFLKKMLWHRCFPVNCDKFLRALFFIKHLRWLLLIFYLFQIYNFLAVTEKWKIIKKR